MFQKIEVNSNYLLCKIIDPCILYGHTTFPYNGNQPYVDYIIKYYYNSTYNFPKNLAAYYVYIEKEGYLNEYIRNINYIDTTYPHLNYSKVLHRTVDKYMKFLKQRYQ